MVAPYVTVCDAVICNADCTSAGVQFGCAWRSSAIEPATCGLAIEVPLRIAQSRDNAESASNGCSSAYAAKMSTPGALMPGDRLPI